MTMRAMNQDDVVAFMREGTRTGKVGVIRADGSPSVTPVWFDFDDETNQLVFVTQASSLKGKSLARDGRISICTDDSQMPFAFARIDGVAELTHYADDPDGLLKWAIVTCRRYVGDDRADEFGARNASPGEVLVRVTPTRYVGAFGITD